MQYEYGGWNIDATPDFSLGKFFARAQLTRASPGSEDDAEMHVERDLAWFDREEDAIEFAHQWAIMWIDKNGSDQATTGAERPISANGQCAETVSE